MSAADREPEDFDALISDAANVSEAGGSGANAPDPEPRPVGARRMRGGQRWLLVASLGVGLLGVGAIATGAIFGMGAPDTSRAETPRGEEAAAEATAPEAPAAASTGLDGGASHRIDPAWIEDTSSSTGIPPRALAAYAEAANRAAADYPSCGIGWNTLAGIGFVESEHGTIDGSSIAQNGIASPPIRGIALDGIATARIPDTDGGALDHDTVWDRAVGPMQFIPSTWAEWGSDGNDDGIVDPQNIDDAAYSAARYLCSIAGDMRDPERWIAAVAGYNDTVEYNNLVADAANHYANLL